MSKTVLVAMSGGVDSSVAALLLMEQGYNVVGAHMKLWDYAEVGADVYRDGRCCSLDAVNDCRAVCDAIDAPFYVLNLSQQFRSEVIDNFVSEYKAGRTPNPCVRCNTDVKWRAFLQKAREIGCDYIATGHYARIEKDGDASYLIRKGVDDTRDQSYFLWGLTQEALAMTLMPLGGLHKSEVREIARRHGLKTSENKESREICFVADDDYHRFLREWDDRHETPPTPGDIVDESGQVLARHDGAAYFTIGQRRGMGISHPTPLYVLRIDAANSRVVVGDDASLYSDEMVVENVNWIATPDGDDGRIAGILPYNEDGTLDVTLKIRYQHPPAKAKLAILVDNTVRVTFEDKQRAITPGQSAAFYDNDILLGGGVIG